MTKPFGNENVFTMKLRIENNQGCVQFINKGRDIAKLRKDKAISVLDLRSVGYFKVSYQKMITLAESRQTFKMYHYQQVRKEPKEHIDEYFRMSNTDSKREYMRSVHSTKGNSDKYPWLAEDDPRRHQTDAEILHEKINLKDSALRKKEKAKLMKLKLKYRDAFSLRDEIGECPNLIADIKVIDESPFFVRPFLLSETDKPFMDKQIYGNISIPGNPDKEEYKPSFPSYVDN